MHIFKTDSRNDFNEKRNEEYFISNYLSSFGLRLPHMDTVNEVLKVLDNNELEKLKDDMISIILERKILNLYRVCSKYHQIVFDATGTVSIKEANVKNFPNAVTTTSKNGVVTYHLKVLEAKIVTSNGFAISIGTEWIENEGEYNKQDCELKAFVRLSEKLKKRFPRLPICAVADGLYPNKTTFDICRANGWKYIFTFKDGNLKTVWDDINGLKHLEPQNTKETVVAIKRRKKVADVMAQVITHKTTIYSWINNLSYGEHEFGYVEMIETESDKPPHKFAYISNLDIDWNNVCEIAERGRLRFKIENEGFNTQKNLGYGITHKFSRTSMNAVKNYYTCTQIAHLLNQLFEHRADVQALMTGRQTMKNLWHFIVSHFCFEDLTEKFKDTDVQKRVQIRLAG